MNEREKTALIQRDNAIERKKLIDKYKGELAEMNAAAVARVKKAYAAVGEPGLMVGLGVAGIAGSRILTRVIDSEATAKTVRVATSVATIIMSALEIGKAMRVGRAAKKWAWPVFGLGLGLGARDAIPLIDGIVDKAYDAITKK